MKNIIFLQVLCKDNPFTPSLKLQVPINIPPNIVCLFLFASASTYKSGTDTTLLLYLQWWTKVWYVLYYYFYYYYLYFFLPKSYCVFLWLYQAAPSFAPNIQRLIKKIIHILSWWWTFIWVWRMHRRVTAIFEW